VAGTANNYFTDKHDLLLTALLQRFGQLTARFDAALPEPGSATVEQNLVVYARAALELNAQVLPIAAGLLTELPLLHRFIEAIHREPFGPQRIMGPIADYLAAERRLGRLPDIDVEATTTLLIGATVMLAFTGLLSGRPHDGLAGQLPAIVAALARGFDAPPPPA
jgi:AcrR family transcriptional regulator